MEPQDTIEYVFLSGAVLRVTDGATWSCGWLDDEGVWWEELRRTYDEAVLIRTRNGQIVFSAEE